jgi:aldehyde dehydrogenase (NAD+)
LNKLADAIERDAEEIALLEVLDNGKTLGEATAADVALTVQCYRYYAGWADKIVGSVINPSGPVAKGPAPRTAPPCTLHLKHGFSRVS